MASDNGSYKINYPKDAPYQKYNTKKRGKIEGWEVSVEHSGKQRQNAILIGPKEDNPNVRSFLETNEYVEVYWHESWKTVATVHASQIYPCVMDESLPVGDSTEVGTARRSRRKPVKPKPDETISTAAVAKPKRRPPGRKKTTTKPTQKSTQSNVQEPDPVKSEEGVSTDDECIETILSSNTTHLANNNNIIGGDAIVQSVVTQPTNVTSGYDINCYDLPTDDEAEGKRKAETNTSSSSTTRPTNDNTDGDAGKRPLSGRSKAKQLPPPKSNKSNNKNLASSHPALLNSNSTDADGGNLHPSVNNNPSPLFAVSAASLTEGNLLPFIDVGVSLIDDNEGDINQLINAPIISSPSKQGSGNVTTTQSMMFLVVYKLAQDDRLSMFHNELLSVVIKHPIALRTIHDNILAGYYDDDIEWFINDVNCMFANALYFDHPNQLQNTESNNDNYNYAKEISDKWSVVQNELCINSESFVNGEVLLSNDSPGVVTTAYDWDNDNFTFGCKLQWMVALVGANGDDGDFEGMGGDELYGFRKSWAANQSSFVLINPLPEQPKFEIGEVRYIKDLEKWLVKYAEDRNARAQITASHQEDFPFIEMVLNNNTRDGAANETTAASSLPPLLYVGSNNDIAILGGDLPRQKRGSLEKVLPPPTGAASSTAATTDLIDGFPTEVVNSIKLLGYSEAAILPCLHASKGDPNLAVQYLNDGIPPLPLPSIGGGGEDDRKIAATKPSLTSGDNQGSNVSNNSGSSAGIAADSINNNDVDNVVDSDVKSSGIIATLMNLANGTKEMKRQYEEEEANECTADGSRLDALDDDDDDDDNGDNSSFLSNAVGSLTKKAAKYFMGNMIDTLTTRKEINHNEGIRVLVNQNVNPPESSNSNSEKMMAVGDNITDAVIDNITSDTRDVILISFGQELLFVSNLKGNKATKAFKELEVEVPRNGVKAIQSAAGYGKDINGKPNQKKKWNLVFDLVVVSARYIFNVPRRGPELQQESIVEFVNPHTQKQVQMELGWVDGEQSKATLMNNLPSELAKRSWTIGIMNWRALKHISHPSTYTPYMNELFESILQSLALQHKPRKTHLAEDRELFRQGLQQGVDEFRSRITGDKRQTVRAVLPATAGDNGVFTCQVWGRDRFPSRVTLGNGADLPHADLVNAVREECFVLFDIYSYCLPKSFFSVASLRKDKAAIVKHVRELASVGKVDTTVTCEHCKKKFANPNALNKHHTANGHVPGWCKKGPSTSGN